MKNKLTPEQFDVIKGLMPNYTNSFIAKQMNISREYVRQLRKKYNILCSCPRTRCSLITEEQLGIIIRHLDEEINFQDICKEAGVSRSVAYDCLDNLNVPYKGRKQARRSVRQDCKSGSVEVFLACFQKYKNDPQWTKKMSLELGVIRPAIFNRIRTLVYRGLLDKKELLFSKMKRFKPYYLK